MTSLNELYEIAEQSDIPVIEFQLRNNNVKALSVCDEDGDCIIAVDSRKVSSSTECKVIMAHELGHCKRGAFYNQYSSFDTRSRHEYRADKWAVQQIIPYEELVSACESGCTECWELAEYFDVTESFITKTFEIYCALGYNFDLYDE